MTRRQQTAYLDFLLPSGQSHVTAKELAAACGYTPKHILCSIDNGHLAAFQVPGRADKDNPRLHSRIPIAMARAYLIEHQTGLEDALVLDQFTRALRALPRPLLAAVHTEAAQQLRTR